MMQSQLNQAEKNILKPGFCCPGITDDCMLRCQMCDKWHKDKGTYGKTKPTLQEWMRAARQLRDLVDEKFEIDVGGGEALLVDWLWDFIRYCTDIGFKMTIASNGYLIDKEMAQRIADSGLFSLVLSLDSLDEKVHDHWRGVKGVHARVMRALDNLAKYAPDVHVGMCSIIMADTVDGMLELGTWVNEDPRFKSIYYMVPMQPNNTYWGKEKFDRHWYRTPEFGFYWPQNTEKVHRILDEIIRRRKEGQLIGNTPQQLEAYKKYLEAPDRFVKKGPCNLDRALHISSIGDVFLCYSWEKLGNIRNPEDDIRKLWVSEKAERAREKIRTCGDNCHFLLNCFFEGDYPFVVERENRKGLYG